LLAIAVSKPGAFRITTMFSDDGIYSGGHSTLLYA